MSTHVGGTSRFRRSVAFLAESGVRQFLGIGTGLLTANNTHEVAHAIAPESRVVCVDNDSLVLVHARALLVSTAEDATAYIEADRRDPAASSTPPRQRSTSTSRSPSRSWGSCTT
ncbi:SAM-dependent methyltransferase [Actinopolymorpha sp. B17G11]|uniref:SAM-dependent methyltransferase n=1 Tax=Actinopolymorpha sp. B17G11 TaxID=3160861 RepID=UPI0032E3A51C